MISFYLSVSVVSVGCQPVSTSYIALGVLYNISNRREGRGKREGHRGIFLSFGAMFSYLKIEISV